MGLDENDDSHFLKNGRFIVVPEEDDWQPTFRARMIIENHQVSVSVRRGPKQVKKIKSAKDVDIYVVEMDISPAPS